MKKTMLTLRGRPAPLSARCQDSLKQIHRRAPDLRVANIRLDAVYFALLRDASVPLSGEMRERMFALLDAVSEMEPVAEGGFFITPRKGTRSPWSSKATDIFQHCGVTAVSRVERGWWCRIERDDGTLAPVGDLKDVLSLFHDRMTEGVYTSVPDLLDDGEPAPLGRIDVMTQGRIALEQANIAMGLALNDDEIDYLLEVFQRLKRNPSDAELLMFGQVNSEHCRHKIFNAAWRIDGETQAKTLFDMIRHTHARHSEGTLSAYRDNAAVIEGFRERLFDADPADGYSYRTRDEQCDIVMKVETHNHPTAISPWPGAATGVGGEIRDEAATGRGAFSKAGLSALIVSHLRVPGFEQPWEEGTSLPPSHLATPLRIMLDGPLGGAAFGNEFGRPQLCGVFKTFGIRHHEREYGYHKPIMAAGGMGGIRRIHALKESMPADATVLQIGGPALRIGLGGGAASSMASGSNMAELDFNSVQRDNAEMQRRCQEVVNTLCSMRERNPIISIHDIGAGGLSNACPELVAESGGHFFLRRIPNEEPSMSPMEIWCCEAQERYVLAVPHDRLQEVMAICGRERCPVAAIGETTADGRLILDDELLDDRPIELDLDVILGRPPKMVRDVSRETGAAVALKLNDVTLADAVGRVLRFPAVARKNFLITIGDRSVTGLVARDQMVGPYQVPVADYAMTVSDYESFTGETMAMGERINLAPLNAPASGRMAITEALTNIAAADIGDLGRVKLSANWMCACGETGQDAALYDTVQAVGMEFCPALGISIPVGKDSLSMRTRWTDEAGTAQCVSAPVSLIVSAFAPVRDARRAVTPQLQPLDDTVLLLADLGEGRNRLGGSALAQVYGQLGQDVPDIEQPQHLVAFFRSVQELLADGKLLAYHDRSDGGLLTTVAEMCFAGGMGCRLALKADSSDPAGIAMAWLFAEEAGAVFQVRTEDVRAVETVFAQNGIGQILSPIGTPQTGKILDICVNGEPLFSERVSVLNRWWSELSWRMQKIRDNPDCALEEYDALLDEDDPGMRIAVTFDPQASFHVPSQRPPLAILREQGVNGHVEMAAAFDRVGFDCIDVHMTELLDGTRDLSEFAVLVACGGFSYGDVLGAGTGWARTILYNERLKTMFAEFFASPNTVTLGVCNGCQMLSQLREIIPGAGHWPRFAANRSERFEGRFVTVEIMPSPSLFFRDMTGSRLGVPIAHGEGRVVFEGEDAAKCKDNNLIVVRYLDHRGAPARSYPLNPNGSPDAIAGVTSDDGRATIMMPHPERGFRAIQHSWRPPEMTDEAGWWLRMFQNARKNIA